MKKTVLIKGASSGFGREAVKLFAAKGWNVIASMRSPGKETELSKLDGVLVTRLDVTLHNYAQTYCYYKLIEDLSNV
jgi:NAD(P)-dependent dehydrogenase (short-subunit alcohol dehydrogenase family)